MTEDETTEQIKEVFNFDAEAQAAAERILAGAPEPEEEVVEEEVTEEGSSKETETEKESAEEETEKEESKEDETEAEDEADEPDATEQKALELLKKGTKGKEGIQPTGGEAQSETDESPPGEPVSTPPAGESKLPDLDNLLDENLKPLTDEYGEDFVKAMRGVLQKISEPMLNVAKAQVELANAMEEQMRAQAEEEMFLTAYRADPDGNAPLIEDAVGLVKDGTIASGKEGVNPYELAFAIVKGRRGPAEEETEEETKPKKPNVDQEKKKLAGSLGSGVGGKRPKAVPTHPESLEPDAIEEALVAGSKQYAEFDQG